MMYAEFLTTLQKKNPLIYALTNNVSNTFVADVLLALGCKVIMAIDPREVESITQKADALCINTGTPNPVYERSYIRAIKMAGITNTPTVLDFPGVGISKLRFSIAGKILSLVKKHRSRKWKTLIRGNGSEIFTLASGKLQGGGIDTAHSPEEIWKNTGSLLNFCQGISISGSSNITITDGISKIPGAGAILTKITGFGCVSTAMMAAFLTSSTVAQASLLTYQLIDAVVKTIKPSGPQTMKLKFVDQLYSLAQRSLHENSDQAHDQLIKEAL